MNKYVHAAYCVPCGAIKMAWTKLFHIGDFKGPKISMVSPFTEITLDNGGKLEIGEKFKMRDGAKIRVRKGAICKIGRNTSVNCNNMIACRERIIIGNDVQFSPNVQIYDHDHDFRAEGGVKAGKYKTGSIEIGNNVWIGANTIILRGTKIGDNAVIAAGSIVKGEVPTGAVIVQKRVSEIR
ncbi:acyltransferase [Enterococcus cecorum]|uniref:acyltransferase n=1 Tax=Enterococcus cecorum TaxID=44008 RepID=UPI00148D8E06|nr:acyltransferase [Enterococcus cecorum]MCJ0583046.1 acyltransferase [Enterococcus cecorum]CAI3261085.1 acyltransferase [Enterococcus cecorum]CAI3261514.1 acyltransferase [Enterococcus cecorum]CAI3261988.1 acyltransferase [Enterococcus cecorum]CAI3283017.1 acyltransferase [Enterococcus cecorum]